MGSPTLRRWGRGARGCWCIAAHACNLALGLWALVTHPSNGLLSSADLPPEFGRKVLWWTIVAQSPWVFAMVSAATELRRRADQS